MTDEAKRLLCAAAAGDGHIMRCRTFGDLTVAAGGENLVPDGVDHRTEMLWDGAVQDLEQAGFIRATSPKRELFEVTREGYSKADELKTPAGGS